MAEAKIKCQVCGKVYLDGETFAVLYDECLCLYCLTFYKQLVSP